jgi:metal-responsive CopG/Arc/MetJ family transcriptional regulator
MSRVNVTIPDHLLTQIDETARALGESRSGFLQEASARYMADIAEAQRRRARIRDIDEAIEHAQSISDKIPRGYDGVARIREDRERDGT